MLKTITFEESAKEDILSMFDKTVDKDGFIVEKEDITKRVIASDGKEITLKEFAGIGKDGAFIKSDLPSLINSMDELG